MIDFFKKKELDNLLSYIKNNWNQDHIFLKNIEVFEMQHNTIDDFYNFLYCKREDEYTAILGIININNNFNKQIWLALWHSVSGLDGYLLLNYIFNILKPEFIGVLGISELAKKIYKKKGFVIDKLSHYYVSNENSKLKVLNKSKLIDNKLNYNYILKFDFNNNEVSDLLNNKYYPIKDHLYYHKRFIDNKFYKYQFLHIYNESKVTLILIGRTVLIDNVKIFHCVDCIGELNNIKLKSILQKFTLDHNYDIFELLYFTNTFENIDLYKKTNDEIIPSYFSPYLDKNINFELAFYSNNKHVRFFIADSDQDRPN